MTCKDCLHYEACKNIAYEYAGADAASAYDDDGCCKAFTEICKNFSNKSEWFHFPIKDYKTAYYVVGYGDDAGVIAEPICGCGVKNGRPSVIDVYGDLYEIDTEVYLRKEEAEKEVERRKNR